MAGRFNNPYYRGYNDSGLGEGFDNLAKIFAPPTLQDMYAGAKAQETRQKIQGLQQLYQMAQDPNFDQSKFDRMGAASGQWNPTQGYYAIDTRAGVDRRGQDITAATSIANNYADNDRALQVALMAPTPKDAVVTRPPATAKRYGVPEQSIGIVAAQPGEKNFLPDGRVLEGNPKPLTDAEMKAKILGTMPPDQQAAVAFGNTPVENVNGVPKTRPQVLEGGVAPVDNTHAAQVFNYKTPDGRTGSARFDPTTQSFVDSQTKQALPPGIMLQAPSGVQNQNGLGPTTANATDANKRAAQIAEALQAIDAYAAHLKNNPGVVGIPGAIRGTAQNALSVVQEFASAFGNVAPDAKIGADQAKALAARIGADHRDPAIAQARVMQLDLAYKLAQHENPTGEVSRQALERALETVAGGTLHNNESALESLQALRDIVARGQVGVDKLRNPSAGPPAAAPPAAPAARPRFQNPTTGEMIEWDGQQYVPVK